MERDAIYEMLKAEESLAVDDDFVIEEKEGNELIIFIQNLPIMSQALSILRYLKNKITLYLT